MGQRCVRGRGHWRELIEMCSPCVTLQTQHWLGINLHTCCNGELRFLLPPLSKSQPSRSPKISFLVERMHFKNPLKHQQFFHFCFVVKLGQGTPPGEGITVAGITGNDGR